MKDRKLVVFDMDGVLIDVSGSYRDTVRQTARLFFSPAPAASCLPEPFFALADLATVKQSGGLNNDWDLTHVVINLLFSLLDKPRIHADKNPWIRFRKTIGQLNVKPIADFLASVKAPLATLLAQKGKPHDKFISGLYCGDVGSGNIIKQIFQEVYLGKALFQATYRMAPAMHQGKGYILKENVLIDRQTLETLAKDHILAIATGRPKAEAEYPLNQFKLKDFFPLICTLDDCLRQEKRIYRKESKAVSLSKPHPFMLDAIAETAGEQFAARYYVGDMPDDMLAARRSRAGFKGIGLLLAAPDKAGLKKELARAGADFIIEDFDALKQIIFSGQKS